MGHTQCISSEGRNHHLRSCMCSDSLSGVCRLTNPVRLRATADILSTSLSLSLSALSVYTTSAPYGTAINMCLYTCATDMCVQLIGAPALMVGLCM